MGSRQSVNQSARPRLPAAAAAGANVAGGTNGGYSAGGGGGGGGGAMSSSFGNVNDLRVDILSHVLPQSTLHGRSNRSLSMPGPSISPQLDNSSESSDPDTSSAGFFSLDRWLNLAPTGTGSTGATLLLPSISGRHFDMKCPVCHKVIPSDDVECHFVMCFTRPRIVYNEDVLSEDKGECVICLECMNEGDRIARLPCLCIYHKMCIDNWFKVKNTCPEHPGDD